tara:strand:+ start:326 stop:1849 length:1524 start_codon:yes stop_codon:yes gene_type:complete
MVLWLVEFLARLVKENKMADFDFANLGSMFGGGMGGTRSGLDALLTEDQRKLMGRNATLSAAAALLQASGRGPQRIGLGQALGSALQAGQQGYERTRAGSLQDLLLGEKLKEAQRLGQYQTALTGAPQAAESVQPMEPLTAAQASLLSQTAPTSAAGPFGPSPQRAQLMDQIQAQPTIAPEPLTATEKRYNELMRKADVANQFGKFDDADKLMSQALKIKPPEKYSTTPQFGNSKQGTPISFVLSESGGMKLLDVQRSPEFNYQDTGSYISVRDKNSNRELERIPKTMSPGEVASNIVAQGNLEVNRGNLRVGQGGLNLRQQEFARSGFDRVETPEGFAYVPKAPGAAVIPIMAAGGQQLKGLSGGKPTEGETNAAGFAQRMELAQSIFERLPAGSQPGMGTRVAEAVPFVGGALARGAVQSADTQMFDQAAQDWIRAKLRKESGAAIGVDEARQEYATYFPMVGDTPEKIAQKAEARRVVTLGMKNSAGKAYTPYTPMNRVVTVDY